MNMEYNREELADWMGLLDEMEKNADQWNLTAKQ